MAELLLACNQATFGSGLWLFGNMFDHVLGQVHKITSSQACFDDQCVVPEHSRLVLNKLHREQEEGRGEGFCFDSELVELKAALRNILAHDAQARVVQNVALGQYVSLAFWWRPAFQIFQIPVFLILVGAALPRFS